MKRFVIAVALFAAVNASANEADAELLQTIRQLDAIVFDAGYNRCEIYKLAAVVHESLEFYHDQGGPSYGKDAFVTSMREGICKLDYTARRELVEGSMEVFPLYHNGELYGAVHNGEHRFYAKYPGDAPEELTSIAKFTLLWLLEDGQWKMARALSYDHQVPAG